MTFRTSLLSLLIFTLLLTGPVSAAVSADDQAWELITSGIEFRKFELPDPNNVFVTRMDRNNLNVILESSIAQGTLSGGKETVSGMFSRYDSAINYWGGRDSPPHWGMRNQVVVAINGSYFDLSTGIPQGGQVQSGWYAKPYDKLGGWVGFAWKLDRSAFIGECVRNLPENQFITYPETGNTQLIDDINDPVNENELVIFTPQYQSRTGTPPSVVDVLVEMHGPSMIFPEPAYASGIVREIREGVGNSLIPFDYIVISANGTEAKTLLENVHVGSEVRISQEITSYESDCTTPHALSWTKTYASIQGAFFFLEDGQIREFSDVGAQRRAPRTAIAFNDQYIYFIVVDGRDYYHSIGMSIHELAVFARDTLGANWGVAQDGGGSSTMVINGRVVNNTYCNIYTCTGYYVNPPIYIAPESFTEQSVISTEGNVVLSPAGIERKVANGMMMVVVKPGVYSKAYEPGDVVTMRSDTELHLGPGSNYSGFEVIPEGTQLTITDHMNDLNGVLAKSAFWWYVNYGGLYGWVPQVEFAKQGTAMKYYIRR